MVLISSTSIPSPIPMANVVIPTEVAYKINKSVTPFESCISLLLLEQSKTKTTKNINPDSKIQYFFLFDGFANTLLQQMFNTAV